ADSKPAGCFGDAQPFIMLLRDLRWSRQPCPCRGLGRLELADQIWEVLGGQVAGGPENVAGFEAFANWPPLFACTSSGLSPPASRPRSRHEHHILGTCTRVRMRPGRIRFPFPPALKT